MKALFLINQPERVIGMSEKTMQNRRQPLGSTVWLFLAFLLILEIFSSAMMVTNLLTYTNNRARNYISLTEASKNTTMKFVSSTWMR